MSSKASKRVAVTGLGIITAIGESLSEFKEGLFNGKCGIGPITLFDTTGFSCHLAAEVKNQQLHTLFSPREMKRVSRCDLLGIFAAQQALADSGIDLKLCDRNNIGVVLGAGTGGMSSWEKYRRIVWSGKSKPRPSALLSVPHCTLTDLIANRFHLNGYRTTISTACSSSCTSIGYGFDLIKTGVNNIVIAGGSEALSELTFAGFNSLKIMDPDFCRPFDKNRQGLSLGEGAAILVLEDYTHAEDRGASIYAEVLGYALSADAFHLSSPDPEALGMSKAMAWALEKAGVNSGAVDYINAHGTGTKLNDQAETIAIKRVFGEKHARKLSISSTKSMVGHCLGASGAIEAVATILAIYSQEIPPTIHFTTPDPYCDLDYVPNLPKRRDIGIALSNSFAFGGNNTSLVFAKPKILESIKIK